MNDTVHVTLAIYLATMILPYTAGIALGTLIAAIYRDWKEGQLEVVWAILSGFWASQRN